MRAAFFNDPPDYDPIKEVVDIIQDTKSKVSIHAFAFKLLAALAAAGGGAHLLRGQAVAFAAPRASLVVPSLDRVVDLRGRWRFRTGDDPAWAQPALDDSTWAERSAIPR